jgi:hypothetical protein
VGALTAWGLADGTTRLASAGDDGAIRIWDPDTGASVGEPLVGHVATVLALTSWTGADGAARLASAGYDGTVRLWDPQRGRAIRTIEVGPVAMWGLSDAPARRDVLGRQSLAAAVAEQLYRPDAADADQAGPTVVSIEGPWGCGESTLMDLIRHQLPPCQPRPSAVRRPGGYLSVRAALRQICRDDGPDQPKSPQAAATPRRGMVTAWFNPWAHQSGEQVWAGFANEIIEAVSPVLYPTQAARERYWFTRNLRRVDRYALRRALHRRVVSPLLGVALAAVAAPLAVVLAELNRTVTVLGRTVTAAGLALGVPAALLFAGLAHTAIRHRYGRAAHYLPAELFHRPVTDLVGVERGDGRSEPVTDPLRRARAGSLYLHQHDIGDLLADLDATGHDLVVFIDDVDRCRAGTTTEVFEAVNLFLSGLSAATPLHAHFVIGLDPVVVAAHLDRAHTDPHDPNVALYGDDPTPGWAFLRKMVQLPVTMPQVTNDGISRFVDLATAGSNPARPAPTPAGAPDPATSPAPTPTATDKPQPTPESGRPRHPPAPPTQPAAPPAVETLAWRTIEQHPDVQQMIVSRLAAQPDRSIREAKRLLNVWQLYQHVLATTQPLDQPAAATTRARNLVLLAEIITRWPALHRHLHRRVEDRRGLHLLAASAGNDEDWQHAVADLHISAADHGPALANLRRLLRDHDGHAIAELADHLL